jgi:hypothetical protein
MQWARYISEQLQRARYFRQYPSDTRDEVREQKANDIEILLKDYVRKHAPSGSGIDAGIHLLSDSPDKLEFSCDFHHMNKHGYYDGWTNHKAIVRPTFSGIDVYITGRDRNDIKEHLLQVFHNWLTSEVDHPALIEHNS